MFKKLFVFRILCCFIAGVVLVSLFSREISALGQTVLSGAVSLSVEKDLPFVRGVNFDPSNPFEMDFIIDPAGHKQVSTAERQKLLRYFLAALTIADDKLWVNLSPDEQYRIIDPAVEKTEIGQVLLEQDLVLKQLAASLTHPDTPTGKAYWSMENRKLKIENEMESISNLDFLISTECAALSKIWIKPSSVSIYDNNNTVFISDIEFQLESETAAHKIFMAELTENVNNAEVFAPLRQLVYSIVLAQWFKRKFSRSLYSFYFNAEKSAGLELADPGVKDEVFRRYVEVFERGAYDVERKEMDNGRLIKRKYLCGGVLVEFDDMKKIIKSGPVVNSVLGSRNMLNQKVAVQSLPGSVMSSALRGIAFGVIFTLIFFLNGCYKTKADDNNEFEDTESVDAADFEGSEVIESIVDTASDIFDRIYEKDTDQFDIQDILNLDNDTGYLTYDTETAAQIDYRCVESMSFAELREIAEELGAACIDGSYTEDDINDYFECGRIMGVKLLDPAEHDWVEMYRYIQEHDINHTGIGGMIFRNGFGAGLYASSEGTTVDVKNMVEQMSHEHRMMFLENLLSYSEFMEIYNPDEDYELKVPSVLQPFYAWLWIVTHEQGNAEEIGAAKNSLFLNYYNKWINLGYFSTDYRINLGSNINLYTLNLYSETIFSQWSEYYIDDFLLHLENIHESNYSDYYSYVPQMRYVGVYADEYDRAAAAFAGVLEFKNDNEQSQTLHPLMYDQALTSWFILIERQPRNVLEDIIKQDGFSVEKALAVLSVLLNYGYGAASLTQAQKAYEIIENYFVIISEHSEKIIIELDSEIFLSYSDSDWEPYISLYDRSILGLASKILEAVSDLYAAPANGGTGFEKGGIVLEEIIDGVRVMPAYSVINIDKAKLAGLSGLHFKMIGRGQMLPLNQILSLCAQ